MTLIPPGPGDATPAILAAFLAGDYAQFGRGDYYCSPIVFPPQVNGHCVMEGPGSDDCRIHALTGSSPLISGTGLGIAPRGLRLFGISLDAANSGCPVGVDWEGQASSAITALTRPQVDDVQTFGFSDCHIRIKNAMLARINNHTGWDGGTKIELGDCGQFTITQSQGIGGTDYAVKVLGVLGDHASEGGDFGGYYSNGCGGGLYVKDFSSITATRLNLSSCPTLMAFNVAGQCSGFQISASQFQATTQAIQIDDNSAPSSEIIFAGCQIWLSRYPLVLNGQRHQWNGSIRDGDQPIWLQNAQDCRLSGTRYSPQAGIDVLVQGARPTDAPMGNLLAGFGCKTGVVDVAGAVTQLPPVGQSLSQNLGLGTLLRDCYRLSA